MSEVSVESVVPSVLPQKTGRRIEWIDVAKGVAILLTIVGHSAQWGTVERNWIFSFHMPLFFILSGYTFCPVETGRQLWTALKKTAQRLLPPLLITWAVSLLLAILCMESVSVSGVLSLVRHHATALFWGSGITVEGNPALGMLWFLVALFWARVLLYLITWAFPRVPAILFGMPMLFAGVYLAQRELYLPQSLDVVPVALFFLTVGMLWKAYEERLQSMEPWLVLVAGLLWLYWSVEGYYIELAVRSYGYGEAARTVCQAICGTYVCCGVSKALCANRLVRRCGVFLGTNSLWILCIHHLDRVAAPLWKHGGTLCRSGLRAAVVLAVLAVLLLLQYVLRRIFRRNKR